jgi:hypothetical protein
MAYHASRIATHNGEWGNIARYHSTGPNDCASSDPPALKHERSLAHPGSIFYHREVDWCLAMGTHGLS